MEGKIIKSEEIEEKGNEETKVKNLFSSDSPDISISSVKRNSEDKTLGYDKVSDNFYYVLEGEGICLMGGKEYSVKKGDLIVVPKGTKYKNIGNIKLLAISTPKFDKANQVYEK